MTENEFTELAAGHALHALSAEDEMRYRSALAEHPEWERIAREAEQTGAMLADGLADVAPPPSLRESLLAHIAVTPQGDAAVEAPSPDATASTAHADRDAARPWSWRRRLFALAAAIVLLAGIGIATTSIVTDINRPASVVALEEVTAAADAAHATAELASGAQATAYWSASLGTAVLVADGLDELQPGQAYELWLVRDETPISGGVFTAADGRQVTAVVEETMHEGDVIAVTIEEAGGSPTGLPTTEPIIVIATT